MGYTHYYYVPEHIEKQAFNRIVRDVKKVIPKLSTMIILKGWDGHGEPEVNNSLISFNGNANAELDHETFQLKINNENAYVKREDGKVFNFCKTDEKPYDLAVLVVLLIAKYHMGNDIELGSDGEIENDWWIAIKFVKDNLGYEFDKDNILKTD